MEKIKKDVLVKICEDHFSSKIDKIESVSKRGVAVNNEIYRLNLKNKKSYFVKVYKKDKWERLERESEALNYFTKHKQIKTPKVLFVDKKNYFVVYSFEFGKKKLIEEITKEDVLVLTQASVDLHTVKPSVKSKEYFTRPTGRPCFKVENHLVNFETKMGHFLDYYNNLSPEDKFAKRISKSKFVERIQKIKEKIVKEADPELMRKPIPENQWRLNNGDFTFDNVIFQKNNGKTELCFVDFEYFGWDDPLRMIGDFLSHDLSMGLSEEMKNIFKENYFEGRKLGKPSRKRLVLILNLMDIEWMAIYLRLLISETLDRKELSSKDFDREKYIELKLGSVEQRISKLERFTK